jgi:hypothetical protein
VEYIDSYRPATLSFEGGERRPSTRAASLPPELAELARELEIDTEDISPTRYARAATQTDRSETVKQIYELIEDIGESPTGTTLPQSTHEMRRALREMGISIGDPESDDQDRRSTARHEAAHAAVAHALRWIVTSIDIGAGETRIEWPDIMSQKLSDRNFQYAVIGAAGAAGAGTGSWRDENESDRIAVRLKGWTDFATARAKAEKLLADPAVKATHQRLTDALVMCGELHGETVRRVLEDEL